MYLFKLQDILFAIKSIKKQFNIHDYINFSSANTRSEASNKLIIPNHLNNLSTVSRHSYFHRLPTLWNAMPILNFDLPFYLLKSKLKTFPWF